MVSSQLDVGTQARPLTTPHSPKPLSADDIRRAKMQQQIKAQRHQQQDTKAVTSSPKRQQVSEPELNQFVEPEISASGQSRLKRRRVSWPEDNALTEVFTFEMDEDEKDGVGVHKLDAQSFAHAQHLEHERERDALTKRSNLEVEEDDRRVLMEPTIIWRAPPSVTVMFGTTEQLAPAQGGESKERIAQAERERHVLQAMYLSAAHIPVSPMEAPASADPLPDDTQLPIIPLDDAATAAAKLQDHAQQPQRVDQRASTPSLFATPALNPVTLTHNVMNPTVVPDLQRMLAQPHPVPSHVDAPSTSLLTLTPMQIIRQLMVNPALITQLISQARIVGVDENALIQTLMQELTNMQGGANLLGMLGGMSTPTAMPETAPPLLPRPQLKRRERSPVHQDRSPVKIPSVESARGRDGKQRACAFFNTPVGCRNGANCPFIHDPAQRPDPVNVELRMKDSHLCRIYSD